MKMVWNDQLIVPEGAFISLTKPARVRAAVQNAYIRPGGTVLAGSAQRHQLARVHDLRYVDGVMDLNVPNGFADCRAETLRHVLAANGVMIRAVQEALADPAEPVCAPVSGFHHAHYAESSGYCTFNGLMAAIAVERANGHGRLENVLILDGDAHYGDGTEDILSRTCVEGVVNATRWEGSEGAPPNVYPLTAANWHKDLSYALGMKRWDLVLYQAGADAHVDDPYGEGYLNDDDWEARDQLVASFCRDWDIPLVFNLAGGYNGQKTIDLHASTVKTVWRSYRTAALNRQP
jgi:acetoin utilization deacetylase AcuC-like enzyme